MRPLLKTKSITPVCVRACVCVCVCVRDIVCLSMSECASARHLLCANIQTSNLKIVFHHMAFYDLFEVAFGSPLKRCMETAQKKLQIHWFCINT